ncbi:MAG TPA: maleylpyruvate isomerase family mycothiol-dependent enzyme [Mycobacteriales bacterium]|nr:maleylpyruvate isomerase family mycothiol-dependent enzyme [Mycobacteriales bacterium]
MAGNDAASVIADLEAEQDAIEAMIAPLDAAGLEQASGAPGWSIADVVLHLAQSEESVVASITGDPVRPPFPVEGNTTDEIVDNWVKAERGDPSDARERWREARRLSLNALRAADPDQRYPWIAASLRPGALATTRLAEHWAHALDIAEPLGLEHPDTDRLRHIAWLGHRTLPYGFELAGQEPQPVYVELTSPSGQTWTYGDAGVPSRIVGTASDFCRVGAQRLEADASGLQASGPYGAAALKVLRNYAG